MNDFATQLVCLLVSWEFGQFLSWKSWGVGLCVDCQIPQSKGSYCQRKKYLVFTEGLEIAYAMKAAATHTATLKANPDPMRSLEVHKLHNWLTSSSEFRVDSHRLLSTIAESSTMPKLPKQAQHVQHLWESRSPGSCVLHLREGSVSSKHPICK